MKLLNISSVANYRRVSQYYIPRPRFLVKVILLSGAYSYRDSKVWFYYQKDHHLGPFSHSEMIDFYQGGEINEKTWVWRKGFSSWAKLMDIPEFREELEFPPPPPSMEAPAQKESPSKGQDKDFNFEFFAPPVEREKTEAVELPPIPEEEFVAKTAELKTEQRHNVFSSSMLLPALVLLLSGLAVLSHFTNSYEQEKSKRQVLTGLRQKDYTRLKQNRRSDEAQKINHLQMEMAAGYEGDRVWVTLNDSRSFVFFLSLNSRDPLVMSEEQVIARSKAKVYEGVGDFSEWRILQGSGLASGQYNFTLMAYPKRTFGNASVEKRDKVPKTRPAFKAEGRLFLGRFSAEEFPEKLEKWRKKRASKFKNRLDFLEQSFMTISSLVDKQRSIIDEQFPRMGQGIDAKFFEKEYNRSIGPILQKLIAQMIKGDTSHYPFVSKRNGELVNSLRKFSRQLNTSGKKLAERHAYWSTRVRKHLKVTKRERQRFIAAYKKDLKQIEQQLKEAETLKRSILKEWDGFLSPSSKGQLKSQWSLSPLGENSKG